MEGLGQRTLSRQSFHTLNELNLNLGPKRMATLHLETSSEERIHWVLAAALSCTSLAFLVMMIVLVPFPQDLFVPNYSPSQLSPYDHLNMATSVIMMQITAPWASLMIVRSHSHCQRDMMILLALIWVAEMILAAAHILHFQGFAVDLDVPAVLAGILTVGLKLEDMLIHLLMDCKSVLYIDFRIGHLQRLLRWEFYTIIVLVVVTLCDATFETGMVLLILGSILSWIFLAGGLYFCVQLVHELGALARASEETNISNQLAKMSEVLRAISQVRSYKRIVSLHSVLKFFVVSHVLLLRGYMWPFPTNLTEMVYESWGMGFGVFLLIDSTAGSMLWYLGLMVGAMYLNGVQSIPATHARHQEEKLRVEKRTRQQKIYCTAKDQGWQEKVEDLAQRAVTLEALLKFYKGLGTDYMLNFNSSHHTTDDVVRQAIIPLSASEESDMSRILVFKENAVCEFSVNICQNTDNTFPKQNTQWETDVHTPPETDDGSIGGMYVDQLVHY